MKSFTVFFMLLVFVAIVTACPSLGCSCNKPACRCTSSDACSSNKPNCGCAPSCAPPDSVCYANFNPACTCSAGYDPVCATNDCTYNSLCEMTCASATFAYSGPCRRCFSCCQ